MTLEQSILLELCRCALWGTRPEINAEAGTKPDWSKAMKLAQQQTLLGLMAKAMPAVDREMQPDEELKKKLLSKAFMIHQSHLLLNRTIASLKQMMDEAGIDTVLFKGQGLAQNYPDPFSRCCGDIDLYVGERNFLKAMDLLEPEVRHDVRDYTFAKHFNYTMDGVSIEIHKIAEILPRRKAHKRYQEWTVNCLDSSKVDSIELAGTQVNIPPAHFNVIYVMNHTWHHFLNGGIGLRQLCDWSLLLHKHHAEIDQDYLKEKLESFDLIRAWKILGCLVVKYLGLPEQECPLYDESYSKKADIVLDFIWEEGNFGHHAARKNIPRPKAHFAGKFHSFKINARRMSQIISVSPIDVVHTWVCYFITGMRNVFNKVG